MQRLEVSGAVRPIYGSLGVKRLINNHTYLLTYLLNPWCNLDLIDNTIANTRVHTCTGCISYFLKGTGILSKPCWQKKILCNFTGLKF